VLIRLWNLSSALDYKINNTQRRGRQLATNAQQDTNAQPSSNNPVVSGNTLPWELIHAQIVAMDTIAQQTINFR
jgi:hypothetical protein